MTVGYDNVDANKGLLLDLPVEEGTGALTRDVAKPHHPVTLVNAPTWTTLPTGLMVLTFDGVDQYLQCLAASCADLDFTTEDYSLSGWAYHSGVDSEFVIARYELDVSGWELYFYGEVLQLRHSHAGGATTVTGAFSLGWTANRWDHFGMRRSGPAAIFYRNGAPIATSISAGGLIDPETCARDLVNCRFTKNDNFLTGMVWRLRAGRDIGASGMDYEWRSEKHWFAS